MYPTSKTCTNQNQSGVYAIQRHKHKTLRVNETMARFMPRRKRSAHLPIEDLLYGCCCYCCRAKPKGSRHETMDQTKMSQCYTQNKTVQAYILTLACIVPFIARALPLLSATVLSAWNKLLICLASQNMLLGENRQSNSFCLRGSTSMTRLLRLIRIKTLKNTNKYNQ